MNERYTKEDLYNEIKRIHDSIGFINTIILKDYQAIKPYYKNKNEISEMLGVNNALCDKLSSKAEVIYLILKESYPDIQKEKTWGWLVNDKTGKPLWVDFYIPSLNIAIEFDGAQHFHYVERFHKTYEGFLESQYRDELKNKLLVENGIKLIRISYKDKISKTFLMNVLNDTN